LPAQEHRAAMRPGAASRRMSIESRETRLRLLFMGASIKRAAIHRAIGAG